MHHIKLGKWGEKLAAEFLVQRGYHIIAERWRALRGDIDLIAKHGNTIVFIEVKTRESGECGTPEESITPIKQRQLLRLAELFMAHHDPTSNTPCRLDVIAIEHNIYTNEKTIRHHQNCITN